MMEKCRNMKVLFGITLLLISSSFIGCAQTVPLKIYPTGYLTPEDYSIMQSEAEKVKCGWSKKEKENPYMPAWSYYIKEDRDFSKIASISIPDFKIVDPSADESTIKIMLDETANILLGKADKNEEVSTNTTDDFSKVDKKANYKKLFNVVDRTGEAETEIKLLGAVMKYKKISGGEKFKTAMIGGLAEGHCVVEIQLLDNKTQEKLGAVQINSYVYITGFPFGMGALAEARPEEKVKNCIVTIMENIKLNIRRKIPEFKRGSSMVPAEYSFSTIW